MIQDVKKLQVLSIKNIYTMSLETIKDEELKQVFIELEEAFQAIGRDFYLVGAQARDIWFAREGIMQRQTKDIDVAVYIANPEDYRAVKDYLAKQKNTS